MGELVWWNMAMAIALCITTVALYMKLDHANAERFLFGLRTSKKRTSGKS
nr:hypothetical protein [Candidatus Kuenenia stuttgartiensis]